MNDIDDIFKDKLRNEGLEYRESYWDNMARLLDRKKRRKAILLFSSLFLVVAGILITSTVFLTKSGAPVDSMAVPAAQSLTSISTDEIKPTTSTDIPKGKEGNLTSEATDGSPLKKAVNKNALVHGTSNPEKMDRTDRIVEKSASASFPSISEPIVQTNSFLAVNPETEVERLSPGGFIPAKRLLPGFESGPINYAPFFITKKTSGIIPSDKDGTSPKSPWQYFIAAGYEYDKYSRKLNIQGLKANEMTMNTSGYNLNFTASKNHWGFRSGVGLLQLSERTDYNTIHKFYSYDTTYRMVNHDYGQTFAGARIALIKQRVDTNVRTNQSVDNPGAMARFNYLKIPLVASYEFRFGSFGLTLDAGLNTAILMQKKGVYTEFSGNDFQLKDAAQSRDFNKVLFQSYTAAGLKYHLGSRWNIVGTYGLTQSLNSIVKSYQQKPKINFMSIGLQLQL